jgi:hypothetical protein
MRRSSGIQIGKVFSGSRSSRIREFRKVWQRSVVVVRKKEKVAVEIGGAF